MWARILLECYWDKYQPDNNIEAIHSIPPLAGEPRELIELDDDLTENPTIASLSVVDTTALNVDDSSPIDDETNDMDTLLAMLLDFIKILLINYLLINSIS